VETGVVQLAPEITTMAVETTAAEAVEPNSRIPTALTGGDPRRATA
jgi:hypothetical protein